MLTTALETLKLYGTLYDTADVHNKQQILHDFVQIYSLFASYTVVH